MSSLYLRFVGAPPPPEAPREAVFRWLRRANLRLSPAIAALIVLTWALGPTWFWPVVGVIVLAWLYVVIGLSIKIRHERR
jgi:hypothetical protein